MGEPRTPHFYNLRIFECVPEPQNQLFLFLETPGHLKKSKKQARTIFDFVYKFPNFEQTNILTSLEKTGAEQSDSPCKKILKALEMGSISSWKHDMEIW